MLDELTRAGWPALDEANFDGWLARYANGVTNRANSVLPLATPTDPDAALARVEEWYAARDLPAVFQVHADTELDRFLAERGYGLDSPTSVQTANVDEVLRALGRRDADIAESPGPEWLDLWWSVDGRGDERALAVAEKILTGGPALYATIGHARGAAAVGRLALVGEWGGVYCVAVRPDARRQGLGAGVLTALLTAGEARGITRTWLQVRAENVTARRLYHRAGYADSAHYHYRSLGRQNPVNAVS